ncbi:MAG: cobalamin-binding protein [Actinobacteria bacterium]|jgi:methanogenic corrinoid protein MtbC1|nr:MAG: cobalamin-binding protein [Actinomycetota bacterium]
MSAESRIMDDIAAAVTRGMDEEAVSLCAKAIGEGTGAREIIREGLSRGMHEAGELYERHEYFLPELLLASEAMHAGIEAVVPSLQPAQDTGGGETVVLGVVEGDVHEIGKNLVAVMLEAEGYRIVDLGYDVAPERFIDGLRANGARVLALSTMMTTTIPNMRRTVELARELEPRPLIVVGGAPLSGSVATDMGADGYGENSARAPGLIRSLLG